MKKIGFVFCILAIQLSAMGQAKVTYTQRDKFTLRDTLHTFQNNFINSRPISNKNIILESRWYNFKGTIVEKNGFLSDSNLQVQQYDTVVVLADGASDKLHIGSNGAITIFAPYAIAVSRDNGLTWMESGGGVW